MSWGGGGGGGGEWAATKLMYVFCTVTLVCDFCDNMLVKWSVVKCEDYVVYI